MKEDKELREQFVEILHKNGILEATKELKQSLFGSLYDAYNLDRTHTPPAEVKTAEEIFNEWVNIRTVGNEVAENIIKAIHAYHAQFTTSAKSVEVEEAAKEFIYNGDLELEPGTIAWYKHEGFLAGSNWQEQKQADTIVELREENERLRRSLTEIAADYDCHEDYLRMLAKEALKTKEE